MESAETSPDLGDEKTFAADSTSQEVNYFDARKELIPPEEQSSFYNESPPKRKKILWLILILVLFLLCLFGCRVGSTVIPVSIFF